MASNRVQINGSPDFDWEVGDSKIGKVIVALDRMGFRKQRPAEPTQADDGLESEGEGKPTTAEAPGMPDAEVADLSKA